VQSITVDEHEREAGYRIYADGRYEDPDDPQVTWVQVSQGGRIRTVSVAGRRRVPELDRLTGLLTDAFR
jgi:hypothetical protein